MNLLYIGEGVAVAALVAGQLLDVYETYVGVFVQKTESEASGNKIVQLLAKNKYTLLLVQPLLCLGAGIGLFMAANSAIPQDREGGFVAVGVVAAVSAAGAVLGFSRGLANRAANKASKK